MNASQAAQRFCDGSPLLRPFAEVLPLRTDASDPFHLAPVLRGETLWDVDVTLDRQGQRLDLILNAGPLKSGQQLIEGILNAIPVRVFWKDRNLIYLGCNAAFARDAGFADPKDIIGKDDYQMGWRDQAELYRNDDRQVIEQGLTKYLIEEPQT